MPKSLVVGMGPGGLEAAYYLLLKGHDVTIIDSRTNPFAREQRIVLDPGYIRKLFCDIAKYSYEHLHNDYEKDTVKISNLAEMENSSPHNYKFFNSVVDNDGVVTIREIQEFLCAQLKATASRLDSQIKLLSSFTSMYGSAIERDYMPFEIVENVCDQVLEFIHDKDYATEYAAKIQEFLNNELYNKYTNDPIFGTIYMHPNHERSLFLLLCNFGKIDSKIRDTFVRKAIDTYFANHGTENKIFNFMTGTSLSQINVADFDNLIYMGGANRQDLQSLITVETKPLPIPKQIKQDACGVMRLRWTGDELIVKDAVAGNITKATVRQDTVNISHRHLPILAQHGWKHNYVPTLYLQFNRQDNTFYITGQVPLELNACTQAERDLRLLELAKDIIRIEYPKLAEFCQEHLELVESVAVFNLELSHLSLESIQKAVMCDQTKIFVGGDAFANANFFFGHGIMRASSTAYSIYSCFDASGKFRTADPYLTVCAQEIKEHEEDTSDFNDLLWYLDHPRLFRAIKTLGACNQYIRSCSPVTWTYNRLCCRSEGPMQKEVKQSLLDEPSIPRDSKKLN